MIVMVLLETAATGVSNPHQKMFDRLGESATEVGLSEGERGERIE